MQFRDRNKKKTISLYRYCVNKLGTFRWMKHRLRVEKDGNDCESIRVSEIRSELHLLKTVNWFYDRTRRFQLPQEIGSRTDVTVLTWN